MGRDLEWMQGLRLTDIEIRRSLEQSWDPIAVRAVQAIDAVEETLQTKIQGLEEVNSRLADAIDDLEKELAKSRSQRELDLMNQLDECKWSIQRKDSTIYEISKELTEYRDRYKVWNILRTADLDAVNTSD